MQILQIMDKTMRYSKCMQVYRLLEMEVILSVIDVGILAIIPEGACHQTTGFYIGWSLQRFF